jgi:hypothetical protein
MSLLFSLIVGVAGTACPYKYLQIESGSNVADVVVVELNEADPSKLHCSRVWPNEEPEFTLIPAPPGCLFFNTNDALGRDNQIPMKLTNGDLLHWVPEPELGVSFPESDLFDIRPIKCQRVLSKTITGDAMIVVGENCVVPATCVADRRKATSTCDVEEESTTFLEPTGWHRNLGACLHADFKHIAYQWIPRQFFAEPDELVRRALKKSESVSVDINIEHPSLVSPPQVVQVDAFPFPVHARVNPPKRGETHFTVTVPRAVWMVPSKVNHCAVEGLHLASLVKLPQDMQLPFTEGKRLVRTKPIKGDSYASTDIPTGNPEDLQEAVLVTAVTATAGAVAIIVASLRK